MEDIGIGWYWLPEEVVKGIKAKRSAEREKYAGIIEKELPDDLFKI